MPEPYLAKPAAAISILQQYGIRTQKKYGQNFLIDAHIPEKIVDAAGVTGADCILEIGPGIGTLTQYLAARAGRVIAVEVDTGLIPVLSETLAEYENTLVISADVLKVDLKKLIEDHAQDRPVKVVANLPYYITTPILMGLFRQKIPAQSVTVMVQKEVADRMTAQPGGKDYGSLSIAVQYYSRPRIVEIVPPESFVPRPKVTSAIVTMDLYEEPPVKPVDENLFIAITRAAFEQRRKTLVNALSSNSSVPYGKDSIREALKKMGLSPSVRGEALSPEEFIKLSDLLKSSESKTG